MIVVADNSGCCAIKHIRNFAHHPDATQYLNTTSHGHDEDQCSSSPPAYDNWLNTTEGFTTPMKAGDALREIVKQIKERRPQGMITINLVANAEDEDSWCCEECNGDYDEWRERNASDEETAFDTAQVDAWTPLLTELGFTDVAFINSNSRNRIHHFTLVYG